MGETFSGCMNNTDFHKQIRDAFDELERAGGEDFLYLKDRSAKTYFIAKENRRRKAMLPLVITPVACY